MDSQAPSLEFANTLLLHLKNDSVPAAALPAPSLATAEYTRRIIAAALSDLRYEISSLDLENPLGKALVIIKENERLQALVDALESQWTEYKALETMQTLLADRERIFQALEREKAALNAAKHTQALALVQQQCRDALQQGQHLQAIIALKEFVFEIFI